MGWFRLAAPEGPLTLESFAAYFAPNGNISMRFCGRDNVQIRQAAMLWLTGQRLPQAKCGVGNLESAVHAYAQSHGWEKPRDCMAYVDRSLEEWLQARTPAAV